jgi:hypothetical protein
MDIKDLSTEQFTTQIADKVWTLLHQELNQHFPLNQQQQQTRQSNQPNGPSTR